MIHRMHPMCNPLCATFFEQFVFCPVPPLCNTQENFQLKNDKNERKWVERPVFPVSPKLEGKPIDSKSLFDDSR